MNRICFGCFCCVCLFVWLQVYKRFEDAQERNAARLEELQSGGAPPEEVAAAAMVLRNMAQQAPPKPGAPGVVLEAPATIRVVSYVEASPSACFQWVLPSFYNASALAETDGALPQVRP